GLVQVNAGGARILPDDVVPAQQDGRTEALVDVGYCRPHHLAFLAFGENDALGLAAHAVIDALQCGRDRVTARRQFVCVAVQVDDRPTGDARIYRSPGDRDGNGRYQPRIERHGDDIVRPEARTVAPIGGGDVIRHILAREFGQRPSGGDLHLVIDGGGAHVQRATENIGKAQDVVDLVRIVRPARGHDRVAADSGNLLRRDLGV